MKKLFSWILLFFMMATPLWSKYFYAQGPKDKKAIAFTFDDGPGKWTIPILDILDKEGVKATFFMNGDQVAIRPKIAQAVKERGHEIGDHTYSHMNFYAYEKKFGLEKTKEKISEEIQKSKLIIESTIKSKLTICRMPHGYNRSWMEEIAKKFNTTFINWTFGEDWHKIPQDQMIKDYTKAIHPGAILLFHDGGKNRKKTLDSLPPIIQAAQKKGYTIVPVSELINP